MKGFDGVWTALITPFNDEGAIDFEAYRALIGKQIEAGVSGIIPCGTTGEAPALTHDERHQLIVIALAETRGTGLGVIAGTGSNNAAATLEASRKACELGVDGILVVTPYYNKPSQAGLEHHFTSVADAVDCPVVLYNVPSRTGVNLDAATVATLARHPRITALKDATGQMSYMSNVQDHLFAAGTSLDLLSGDDATFFPFLCQGGKGVISVTSNICPAMMLQIWHATREGNLERARQLQWHYYPLFRDLFLECNPVPIKFALSQSGLCRATVRAPLASLMPHHAETLLRTMDTCRVLENTGALHPFPKAQA